MTTPNADLPADFAAVYAKRYPDRPAPLVRQFDGNRFEIQEGWAKRTARRADMLAEIATMFVQAATGGGAK